MGKESCLHLLLGTDTRPATLVDVSVLLSCDFHVSNLLLSDPQRRVCMFIWLEHIHAKGC